MPTKKPPISVLLVPQWCLILCDPVVGSLPGSSVHRILQARILEWVAIPFSRGSSPSRDKTLGLPHCRQILYHLSHQEKPRSKNTLTVFFCFQSSLSDDTAQNTKHTFANSSMTSCACWANMWHMCCFLVSSTRKILLNNAISVHYLAKGCKLSIFS